MFGISKDRVRPRLEAHYDALGADSRGRSIGTLSLTEDRVLNRQDRAEMTESVREAERNFSLAGFAIRKHIQYMSEFRFSCDTDDEQFNNYVERLFHDWANDPDRCHAQKRHAFPKLLTLIERHRLTDGDVGVLKCNNGSIEIIEGERIRSEWSEEIDPKIVHGVHLDRYGANKSYEIWKRPIYGGAWEKERDVSAKHLDLIGYYDRHDQIRGVSPLAPAVHALYQLHDGISFALAKMKLEQLIGLVTKRLPEAEPLVPLARSGKIVRDDDGRPSINEQAGAWREEFGKGLKHLDLSIDETAEFLTGNTPSQNFQSFTEFVIRIILASLDVPYSFLDGSKTNYYGSKGELNGYVNGCRKRQEEMIVWLNKLTRWLFEYWVMDGSLRLPAGMEPGSIPFSWVGAGTPFWRLIDDSKGYQVAVQNGFTNPEAVCNEHGGNFYDNVDRMKACLEYAREHGIILPWDPNVMGKVNTGL